MSELEKRSILEFLRSKYRRARKKEKSVIIGELADKFSVSRKHASRLLSSSSVGRPKKPGKKGRPSKYRDFEFVQALRELWRNMLYMCERSMKEAIPVWLPAIEQERGKRFPEDVRARLLMVSSPTIGRILKPYKVIKGRSFTRSGGFREQIPIQENIWDIKIPGFTESDTVAHCGGSLLGEFINSLTMVDICTIWTEVRAVFGRGSAGVFEKIMEIESDLPFEILGYDSDNGGEVLNHHVLSYFEDERKTLGLPLVTVTRSREYKKNDNAHVEQRNDSVARKYLGYERLDYRELTPLVNYYYRDIVCPLINHFVPCFKLKDKKFSEHSNRPKRIYAKPQTPYARVMASEHVSRQNKEKLKQEHGRLNPIVLMKLERKLRALIDQHMKQFRNGSASSVFIPESTRNSFRDLCLVARATKLKAMMLEQQTNI